MANSINIPRAHLIMALCLPLAVLIGYFLAEPTDLGSVTVLVVVMAVLISPLFVKWYHVMLVLAWNACINPMFLPGAPAVWMPMALLAFGLAIVNRSINPHRVILNVPSVTRSLIFLGAVVIITGMLTGGFGFRFLGSATYGSKRYVNMLAAIAGYFALVSHRIPPQRAGLYAALFFLPGMLAIVPNIAHMAGAGFDFLYYLFPSSLTYDQEQRSVVGGITRMSGLTLASTALWSYMLARYGIRGVFDLSRPFRAIFLLAAVAAAAACGYRSFLLLFLVTFLVLFFCEGLHRTSWLPLFAGLSVFGLAILAWQSDHLPWVVQRTLSFLPGKWNPIVKDDAGSSVEWRLDMWRAVLPQVPKHLIVGKGYVFDPGEMYFSVINAGHEGQYAASALAGDYHSGPLSVILPFGLGGVIGFLWFVYASVRYLYRRTKYGDPSLLTLNTFLLAAFIAKFILFLSVFGSLNSDLFFFTGIIGFSVSLNGAPATRPAESEASEDALQSFPQSV